MTAEQLICHAGKVETLRENSGLGGSLSNEVGQERERQKRHKVSKPSKFVTLLTLLTPEFIYSLTKLKAYEALVHTS